MISIKQEGDDWKIIMGNCDCGSSGMEVWQFKSLAEMEKALHTILQMKNSYRRWKTNKIPAGKRQ